MTDTGPKSKSSGGGGGVRSRGPKFGPRVLPARGQRVVKHGHVTDKVAEIVWTELLDAWGIGGTNTELREDIVVALAESLVQGTSIASDLEARCIIINDELCSLGVLKSLMVSRTNQSNPVKVFLRSFRKALIPIECFRILSAPENETLRAEVALRSGCELSKAPYAFDMFNDAAPFLGLSAYELLTARSVSKTYLAEVHAAAVSRPEETTPQDTSSRQAQTMSAVPDYGGSQGRLGFSSLR